MIYFPLVFQDEMEEMEGLKSELRAALVDKDGAAQVCVCDANGPHCYASLHDSIVHMGLILC